ncbi:hypothetical protein BGX26_010229, partial [Mortierella sp. AD094]
MGNKTPSLLKNPEELHFPVGSSNTPEAVNESSEADHLGSQIDGLPAAVNNNPQEYPDQGTTDSTPTLTQEATASETLKSPLTLPQKQRNPPKHTRESSKPLNPMRCRRQPCQAMHFEDICRDLGVCDFTGPLIFTSKNPRRLKRLHAKFHKDAGRNRRSQKFTDPNRPFASIVPPVSKNDKSCIPLLRELLKRPSVVRPEVTIAMPLLFSHYSLSPSPPPPQQPQSSQPPNSLSPTSSTSNSSSPSSWEPWFVYRDPGHQNRSYLGYRGGGGGGGDSSDDDSDSYFSSDDDESNSEDDRRRRRNHQAHRNRDSENEAIANTLAAAAASAASAAASAEASAYSADAACASANASSASAAASSESATAAAASVAIVFAYFSDPFPGATNAFQSMVSLPSTSPSARHSVPTSIARQSSPPSVVPTYVATSAIHTATPTAAPTSGATSTSHASVPTVSVATQTGTPAQPHTTPVLDFIELANSAGVLDTDLFNACYLKAVNEIDFSRDEDLERFKRINLLAEYYPEPQSKTPSSIEYSQPTAGASPPAHTEDVDDGGNDGNTIDGDDDDDDDADTDGGDEGDEDDDDDDDDDDKGDNNRDGDGRGGDSHHGNNPGSGDNDYDEDDTSSSARFFAPRNATRSILKRGRMEGDDGGQDGKRHYNCRSHLEFSEAMGVRYLYKEDVARVESAELIMPFEEAPRTGVGRIRRGKLQSHLNDNDDGDTVDPRFLSRVEDEQALWNDLLELDRFLEGHQYLVIDLESETSSSAKQEDSGEKTPSSHEHQSLNSSNTDLFYINEIMNRGFDDKALSGMEEGKSSTAKGKGKAKYSRSASAVDRAESRQSHIRGKGSSITSVALPRLPTSPSAIKREEEDDETLLKIWQGEIDRKIALALSNRPEDSDRCLKRRRDQEESSSTNDDSEDGDNERSNKRVTNVIPSLPVPRNLSTTLAGPELDDQDIGASEIIAGLDKIKKEEQEDLYTDVKIKTEDEEVKPSYLEDYSSSSTTFTSIEPTPNLKGNDSEDEYLTTSMPYSSQTLDPRTFSPSGQEVWNATAIDGSSNSLPKDSSTMNGGGVDNYITSQELASGSVDPSNRGCSPSSTGSKRKRSPGSSYTIESKRLDTVKVLAQRLSISMESQGSLDAPVFGTASVPAV